MIRTAMKIIDEITEVARVAESYDAFSVELIVELYLSARYIGELNGQTINQFVKGLKDCPEIYGSCFRTTISVGG